MRKFCSLVLAFSAVAGVLPLRADIIPSFVSAVPSNGNTVVTYQIDTTAEQNATTGDFFTIYDFGSFIPNSNSQPANWTFSSSLSGLNPPKTNAPDDPTIPNLTWTYTGSTPLSFTGLGPFSVTIPGVSDDEVFPTRSGFFAAQGTLVLGPDSGTHVGNAGSIPIPVPEPMTMLLLTFGGGAIVSGRFRKR